MINPTELRAGNIIMAIPEGKTNEYSHLKNKIIVDGLEKSDNDFRLKRIEEADIEQIDKLRFLYRPVPITPEIIEKYEVKKLIQGIELIENLVTVHQLQNMYFVITGEEIEIDI